MIQKVRWRFILMSIVSLAIVLFVSIGTMIFVSFNQAHGESNQVMDTLIRNNGQLNPENAHQIIGNTHNPIRKNFTTGQGNPEAISQYRYFTIWRDPVTKKYKIVSGQKILGLTDQEMIQKAQKVLKRNHQDGIAHIAGNNYRYTVVKNNLGQSQTIFLNTSLIYAHSWYLLKWGSILALAALTFFTIILIIFSNKVIRPIIQAYRKQRQFVTNAGHELKTPLAIIAANTEMEEMIGNQSEWTESTKQQTKRLTDLINHLISMARLGETGDLVLSRVNFSQIVSETAKSFSSLMRQDSLFYQVNIQDDLFVKAEEKNLTEIVNILLDNAHKYCLPNGQVRVDLHKSKLGKNAILRVSNSFKDDKNIDFDNFFDRFYREDESHNSKKSGFGIGLSMAQDLVKAFNGKINVHYADQIISFEVNLKLVK